MPRLGALRTRMIWLIDNYDSFTYNLVHAIGALGAPVHVVRNDALSAAEVIAQKPSAIVISPGPATPNEAGICLDLIPAAVAARVPLLGVCLGHQTMGQAFGSRVVRAPAPLHGKTDDIRHNGTGIAAGLPSPFTATRYHSLMVAREDLPACLEIVGDSADGVIQIMQHRTLPMWGVQFHPESIATTLGPLLIKNFLTLSHLN